jgi:hypothetical protein
MQHVRSGFLHSSISGVETSKCIEKNCTRQSVLIAEKTVKSHSNPIRTDQFTAENATRSEDLQEDSKARTR